MGNAIDLRNEVYGAEGLPNIYNYSLNSLPYVEYGIDGFTSVGVTVIAGEAGLGKTSAIVPIAATIAHLVRDSENELIQSLKPTLRRKVVYLTEDKGQVERLLYGLKTHRSDAADSEFREWFIVIESHRKLPEELAANIAGWRKKYSYHADDYLCGYLIEPLIVIDTTNANVDLDDENDNAEVGKAIAAFKGQLGINGMTWFVAHISKAMARSDVSKMTVRGAGAWGADANATAFLVSDDKRMDKRFLILDKKRFEPKFNEIEITSTVHSEFAVTPWGEEQQITYRVCDLKSLSEENGMKSQSNKFKIDRFRPEIEKALADAYDELDSGKEWKGLTSSKLEKAVTGKAKDVRDAFKSLSNEGKIKSLKVGNHDTATVFYWLPYQHCGIKP